MSQNIYNYFCGYSYVNTHIISVVNFCDYSNFNRKKGRTYPYNTPKVVYSPHNIHSLFLCRCTLLGNGRYKSNYRHPLRSRPLFPYKSLRDIFVHCSLPLYDWCAAHSLDYSFKIKLLRWLQQHFPYAIIFLIRKV